MPARVVRTVERERAAALVPPRPILSALLGHYRLPTLLQRAAAIFSN